MKEKLIKFLKEKSNLNFDFEKLIEIPKISSQGDFSLPCFILAKELKNSPQNIAKELEIKLNSEKPNFIFEIKCIGPFLNFYLNKEEEIKNIIKRIDKKEVFNFKIKKPKRILLEFPSPNTNKSLHLGHMRNIFLGNSLSKILEKTGFEVIRTNMNNDRGIAICKAMLSYELFADNKTPQDLNMKSDDFVSHFYSLYENKNKENPELELDKKAQEMLVLWEKNDKKTHELWKKLMDWVFEGYKETYKNFKLKKYDKQYYESKIYKKGKEIVSDAYKNGIKGFKMEEDGAIYYDFENEQYGKKYLLRGDGTSLYMTQDLYLATLKDKEFKPDKSIFIVGEEQKYHFEVLFHLFEVLGLSKVENNFHLAYGYVYNKDGKKFSSRKGNIVSADYLLEEVISKAKENLLTKENSKNLNQKEIEKRSKIIGYSALAFSILKINPSDSIKFDIDKALSFEGESGVYIMYTYARIKSILKKSNFSDKLKIKNLNNLNEKEITLFKIIDEYPSILEEASLKYKISAIANYLIKLSQNFNDFYQNNSVLNAETKESVELRLYLINTISEIIKNGLDLLTIDVLEEM